MKTIGIVGQKGGCGKSVLSVHLAVCAARKGKRVAVIDLDPQGTVSAWRALRVSEDVAVSPARIQDLRALLADLERQGVDWTVIDTAGRAESAASTVMAASTLVLVPCRPFAPDVAASGTTARQAQLSRARAWFVLNAVPPLGTRAEEAREALSALLPVAPVELGQRLAYADALNDGRSVEELGPNGKAAAEIQALYRWVSRQCV